MPIDKRLDSLLGKVRRLRQTDEVWEGSGRIARLWITPRNTPPYRPYLIIFVAADRGVILRTKILDDPPTPDRMFEELLQAMHRPLWGAGGARRPLVVYLDSTEHVAALAPRLAELGVRCEQRRVLPELVDALYSFEKSMNKREPVPGLLKIPGVTPPLVGHLYELAADYYRLAPWHWLTDQHPLEIRYPPDGPSHYAVVMGSGGEVFGLAVYDSFDDLRLMYTNIPPKRLMKSVTWFVLFFERAIAMTFDDLDAMEQHGWPVAAEQAYPVFGRTTPKAELVTPTRSDVYWMEGALAGILSYVRYHKRIHRGVLQPATMTLPVTTIGGEAKVYLRLPAVTADIE